MSTFKSLYNKYSTHDIFIVGFLLLVSCFPIFFHLGANYIQIWDEGIYAVNAYEMHLDGDLLVKHYNTYPEVWATNPPLVCYFQTLCIKIFGPGEFAIRFPSALAALGVVILIIRFCTTEKLGLEIATYAVLMLITAKGYITFHVTRTGDLDSSLIFFITGSIIYFYKFIEYEEKKIKYLVIFSVFILLGYFTKGIAAFLVLPAFFFYALLKHKLLYVLKTKQLYYCIFSVLFLICLYYFLREQKNPGYINEAFHNEIGRWSETRNDWHNKPIYYYLKKMYDTDFKGFVLLIPAFFILFFFIPRSNPYRSRSTIWGICIFTFLAIVSFSKTKTEWYAAPLYPMLCIYAALGIKSFLSFNTYSYFNSLIVKVIFALVVFIAPYISIIQDDLTVQPLWHDIKFGEALKKYNKMDGVPKKIVMLVPGFRNGQAMYYKTFYNDKFGYDIEIEELTDSTLLETGKVYLFTHPGIISDFGKHYNYFTYLNQEEMKVVKILGKR